MASTIRYDVGEGGGDQYEGINSERALDMHVSGSQILRPRMLISIRIPGSLIEVRVGVRVNPRKPGTCPRRSSRLAPPSSPRDMMARLPKKILGW